jgi:DNA invertase Pin-like site-specific DNA recombinase
LISSKTKEALARLKSEGKKLGRAVGTLGVSKLTGKIDEIKMLLVHKVAKAAIARMINVSRPALYDFIESRRLKVQSK